MSRKSGYFICYRNIWQHPVFKNLLQASCWIYMISSASHQDKDLTFLDNKIFVRRGEMIMPLRVTAKRFKMTYSEMRTFILRLVRRKMITTRVAHLQPTADHKNRKVTLINIINYDKFQYVNKQKSHTDHTSQDILNNNLIEHTKLGSSKDNIVNSEYKIVSEWGQYNIIMKDGKKYKKHKWKNEPIVEYQ